MDDTGRYYHYHIGTNRSSFTYNTSTSLNEWNWKDVIQHYSGDPLSTCSNCSKRDNCNEECMKKEYENIKPPKNFIKSLVY